MAWLLTVQIIFARIFENKKLCSAFELYSKYIYMAVSVAYADMLNSLGFSQAPKAMVLALQE
jgi:hypothetical protein